MGKPWPKRGRCAKEKKASVLFTQYCTTVPANFRLYIYVWADHLIPGLIFFFREIIIRSEMATEWDTWQLCTSVCAKPEVGISPHSLRGGPWVNVYNSVRRISR